jgi:hypothetical protein
MDTGSCHPAARRFLSRVAPRIEDPLRVLVASMSLLCASVRPTFASGGRAENIARARHLVHVPEPPWQPDGSGSTAHARRHTRATVPACRHRRVAPWPAATTRGPRSCPAICHALDPTRSFLMGAPRNRAINPFSVALRGPQIFLRVECFLADYPAASAAGRRSDCPVRGGRDGCQTALRSRKFRRSRDSERTCP